MLIMNRSGQFPVWLPFLATVVGLTAFVSARAQDGAAPAKSLVYPLDVSVSADAKTLYLVDRKLPGLWKAGSGKSYNRSKSSNSRRSPPA